MNKTKKFKIKNFEKIKLYQINNFTVENIEETDDRYDLVISDKKSKVNQYILTIGRIIHRETQKGISVMIHDSNKKVIGGKWMKNSDLKNPMLLLNTLVTFLPKQKPVT